MPDDASLHQARARRGYAVIDLEDLVDVTSYDSFPASDPPSWIATGIGSPHAVESPDRLAIRAPPLASETGSIGARGQQ